LALGRSDKRIAAFIDGSNWFETFKSVQLQPDYQRLLKFFRSQGDLVRANYYTAMKDYSTEENLLRPLIDWMDYNGYNVVTKPTKSFLDPKTGESRIKGNMDIEITLGILDLIPYVTDIYLFSGDGDFVPVVRRAQDNGVRVTVVSTILSRPSPMIADELRRQADVFIDIGVERDGSVNDFRNKITRE
jgi:uncharacterized LabA/DUF88 family protein